MILLKKKKKRVLRGGSAFVVSAKKHRGQSHFVFDFSGTSISPIEH